MPPPYCIDPDDYLDLSRSSEITREEGAAAWDQAYAALQARLTQLGPGACLYLVFGLQAAGKSSWVKQQSPLRPPRAVYFSGPLPSARHRQRALAIARLAQSHNIAVWLDTPLQVALARNAGRQGLARIDEATIAHVHDSLQPPSLSEGFDEIIIVRPVDLNG